MKHFIKPPIALIYQIFTSLPHLLSFNEKAGGSLSEILDNIITSLNKANEIRSKIKVLSAEAKVTAYILGGLPVVLWITMMQLNPSYLDFFSS